MYESMTRGIIGAAAVVVVVVVVAVMVEEEEVVVAGVLQDCWKECACPHISGMVEAGARLLLGLLLSRVLCGASLRQQRQPSGAHHFLLLLLLLPPPPSWVLSKRS